MSRDRLLALTVAAAVLAAGGLVASAEPVESAWADPEHASTTVTAATVPRPSPAACALTDPLLGLVHTSVTFTWPAAAGTISGYRWDILNSAGTSVASGTLPVTATSHTVPADTPGLLAVAALTTYTFQLTATSGSWQSQPRTGTFGILLGLGLLGNQINVVSACTGLT